MAVLIKLQNEKAGVNNDAAFPSGGEIVKEILCQWSIPYALPTGLNQEPAEEPVIIGYTFLGGEGSVEVIPYGNGFVTGLIRAYHQGLHLRLAPEDIWLSILSQLRAYAYRHPSSIPGFSSSLDLNVEFTINLDSDLETSDSTHLDEKISGLANIVVNDDDLRDWFTPNFSTTNTTDKAVASIVLIGGLRKSTEPYHDIRQRAGLSSINLLGEKSDWEEILRRVEGRITSFGEEAIQWCKILVPVIQGMISSFDSPNLAQTKEFWHKACHFDGTDLRNDKETMTGWITAFCFWSDSGYCLHPSLIKEGTLHHPRRRISFDEFGYGDEPQIFWEDDKDDWYATKLTDRKEIFIGREKCHRIFPKNVPGGTATAAAYVRDYHNRMVYSVTIVAGSMGAIPTEVGYFSDETVLQPSSGWFLLQDELKAMPPAQQLPTVIEDGHEVFVLD